MPDPRQALTSYASRQSERTLQDRFGDDAKRVKTFSLQVGPIYFDFSKQPIDREGVQLFEQLAIDRQLDAARDQLFAGEILNHSENRPALHTAMRDPLPPKCSALGDRVADRVNQERKACYEFAEKIRNGQILAPDGKPYKHVIHIGIGGSYLGPKLLVDALGGSVNSDIQVHLVANIDGHALIPIMQACDPKKTLVIAVSKTFTTQETLTNTRTVLRWMQRHGVNNPMDQLVAITGNPDAARDVGVADDRIFTFASWIGGRFSIWSSVSLAAIIRLGSKVFDRFLEGARLMDEHYCSQPLAENAPMLAGSLDYYFASVLRSETRAVFPYDARLNDLVPYLQQLEMESNGKHRDSHGQPLDWPTAPIVWGGVGTDAQHAVFQLLHQGTHLVPTEFIAVRRPHHQLRDHHQALLANCFAQSSSLMCGDGNEFPGNKPSTTIVLDRLDPQNLGALLAFYEHRIFTASVLWELNAFDQPGVELGKQMAKQIGRVLDGKSADIKLDPSSEALLKLLKETKL